MGPGTQLLAPKGLGPLVAGITHYVLATRALQGAILLCWFDQGKNDWKVHFTRMERPLFEAALMDGRLVCAKKQATLPPWLPKFEGADVETLEKRRVAPKVTYRERCERRYEQIKTLVERHADIVGAEDPMRKIKLIANAEGNTQKPDRLALWYTAYQLFRRSLDALLPAIDGIGKWIRDSSDHKDKKLGRPNEAQGELCGYSALPLVDRIVSSFFRHAKLTVPMTSIYAAAMVKDFGCDVRADERGIHAFYHPKGLPFPSFWQYRYWVEKELGLRTIQVRKLGATTYRNKKAVSEGPFSESVAHAFERTATDAYYSKVLPTALLSGEPDLPLVTCRLLCLATGMRLGVGCAYGVEDAQAYRSMLFCAAVNKQRFGKIIGLEIGPDDYPCEGLPLILIADRGPGSTRKAGTRSRGDLLPDRGMTPSHTPQSNASVEASHRRETKVSGPPSYVQSNLTAIELMRREFLQAITDNKCSDASSRLTPDMVADGVPANPLAIFRWMERRGRIDAYSIPFEEAVREFLEPVEFTFDSNGLWLLSQRYDSDAFAGTAVRGRITKGQRLSISGYVLPLCVRTAWIETDEGLVEVDAQLALREDEGQLYKSLPELEAYSRKHKRLKAENRAQAPAARAAGALAFEKQTGKSWDGGKRKSGKRPSRSSRRRAGSPPRGHSRKR